MANSISSIQHEQIYFALEAARRNWMNTSNDVVPRLRDFEYGVTYPPTISSGKELASIFAPTYGNSPELCRCAYTNMFMPLVESSIQHPRVAALDAIDKAWRRDNTHVRVEGVAFDVDRYSTDNVAALQFNLRCQLREAFFAYLRAHHTYHRVAIYFSFPTFGWFSDGLKRDIVRLRKTAIAEQVTGDVLKVPEDVKNDLEALLASVHYYYEIPSRKRRHDDDEVEENVDNKQPKHASGFWRAFSSLVRRLN